MLLAERIAREHKDPNGPHAALFGNAVSPPVVAAGMQGCLATSPHQLRTASSGSPNTSGSTLV